MKLLGLDGVGCGQRLWRPHYGSSPRGSGVSGRGKKSVEDCNRALKVRAEPSSWQAGGYATPRLKC